MAKLDGVQFELFQTPVRFTDDGVVCEDTKPEEQDGRVKFRSIPGSEKLFRADSVLVAVSQGPRDLIVSTTAGIGIDGRGLVTTDEDGRTTREGVFASGDVVTGAKTVVEAVRVSKRVADAMDAYVTGVLEAEKASGK